MNCVKNFFVEFLNEEFYRTILIELENIKSLNIQLNFVHKNTPYCLSQPEFIVNFLNIQHVFFLIQLKFIQKFTSLKIPPKIITLCMYACKSSLKLYIYVYARFNYKEELYTLIQRLNSLTH